MRVTEREIAEPNTILRGLVGSQVHGLNLAGTDDRDEMGVCLEPAEYVIGLRTFEQWVFRTAEEREGRKDGHSPRSQHGDLDLTVYSLRKWARLALGGNPTVLLLLYVPPTDCVTLEPWGERLRELAWAFASRSSGRAFLGYLTAQKQRLLGERGGMRAKRPELIEQHGYDTKYAMHMTRLGFQGLEYMRTGRVTLPMPEPERLRCMAIRRGEADLSDILTQCGEMERDLELLIEKGPLPEHPDADAVHSFLVDAYSTRWFRQP